MNWSGAGRHQGRLHDALVESKAAVNSLRDGLAVTSRDLAFERKQLEDAERRGQLAAAIPDQETVEIATRFASRHRERVNVLERKLAVQQDELALAERLLAELMAEARGVPQPQDPPVQSPEAPARPQPGVEDALLRHRMDQAAREAAAEAQLAFLKKKMGKE
ncbi:MAG: hypothetical protein ACHQ2E_01630 [Gemmatimonadales bacterium]